MERSEEEAEREAADADAARPKRSIRQRCCSWGLRWKILVWLVAVVAYLLFGGLIFMLAERPNEVDSVNAAIAERKDLSRLLEERTAAVMAALMASNSTMTTTEASMLIEQVVNISTSLALSSQVLQAETSPLWTYIPSVFFSATIITTIGYGNRAPVTAAGRTLFIFYALIGIPICLVFLSLVGEVLSNHVDSLTKHISKRTQSRLTLNYSTIQAIAITFLVIVGLIIFVTIPSIVMYSVEPWAYGEAVYFCFVTLTTVGFGDFIPAEEDDTPLTLLYSLCIAVWLFFGLAWLALLLTQIQNSMKKMGPFIASKVREVKEKREERVQAYQLEPSAPDTSIGAAEEDRSTKGTEGNG